MRTKSIDGAGGEKVVLQEKTEELLDKQQGTIQEGQETANAFGSMEGQSEEAIQAAQEAQEQAREVANRAAKEECEAPAEQISQEQHSLADEINQVGDSAENDAQKAEGIKGHFAGPGSQLRARLSAVASDYHSLGNETEQDANNTISEAKAVADQIRNSVG